MIRWETETIELQGPLGRLGSIRALDLWQSRESVEQCKELVATVASLSYGNDAAKNPEALFDSIVSRGHLSCLEFVPVVSSDPYPMGSALPYHSLRQEHSDNVNAAQFENTADSWDLSMLREERKRYPATGFLVEAPIFVVRQWMRHRAFSYLEMSRRYVKGAKVPFEFYGTDTASKTVKAYYEDACRLYDILLETGEKPETARRVIPVGAMTRFWVGGFDRDWESSFLALRCDKHAQEEIRVFADWIKGFLETKGAKC